MDDESHGLPLAITGDINVGRPNSGVKLYEGPLKISQENTNLEERGFVELSWFPYPALRFSAHSDGPLGMPFSVYSGKFAIELLEVGMISEALATSRDTNSLTGIVTGKVESGYVEGIDYATFYVPNFVDFIGEQIRDSGKSNMRAARLSFEFEDWQILIEGLPNARTIYEALKSQGGYAVTHIGRIHRKSGRLLVPEEINQICEKLHEYLSFCRGAFCGPLLLTGYDSGGAVVWANWDISRIQAWQDQDSWFPVYFTEQTKQVLASILSTPQDNQWNEALGLAIHWLVEAQNASTVDMGIVHAQIGIELLAWAKFVEIEQTRTREEFGRLNASGRIQLILDWAGIPTRIPEELQNLQNEVVRRRGLNLSEWSEGYSCIIELRNSTAHPNLRNRDADVEVMAKYDVQQLALWYLELLILRLLDYQGEVHNRWKHKRVGETEHVPWAVNP